MNLLGCPPHLALLHPLQSPIFPLTLRYSFRLPVCLCWVTKKQEKFFSPTTNLVYAIYHVLRIQSQLREVFSWSIVRELKMCKYGCVVYALESTHLHGETNLIWERCLPEVLGNLKAQPWRIINGMFHGENKLIRGLKDVPEGCRERSWKSRMPRTRGEMDYNWLRREKVSVRASS